MSTFDDILKQDAAIFVDPEMMPGVESVEYCAKGEQKQTFFAQVFRDQPMPVNGVEGIVVPGLRVFIARSSDPTKGRSKVTIGDLIWIAKDDSGSSSDLVRHSIDLVISNDAGGFMVRLS